MDQGNQRSDSQSEKENIGNLKEFNEIVNYLMQNKLTTPEGYYFSNPDPYLKPTLLPPDHPRHNFWFDEDGHITDEQTQLKVEIQSLQQEIDTKP